jgi:nucleoside 2-deoxyribosyltransferase
MKIYISHSGNYDYETGLYAPIKHSDLTKEHQLFLPHEAENADMSAKEELTRTDLLIAEVSYPSTGQGIEMGLASALHVPIVCLYKAGTEPSGSSRFVSDTIVAYERTDDMLAKIAEAIEQVKSNL